jgi:osomolarity two-component system sensor histidine kinase TcsA
METSLDPNIPAFVLGDPLRYRQVIQNLVLNAIKFTESGSICLHSSLLDEDSTSYTIRTEITDTGIGIKDIAIGSFLTPFTQFDTSATKHYKGARLGLSICKSIAELMGGAIDFYQNPKRQGSVFSFTANLKKMDARLPAMFQTTAPLPVIDALTLVKELAPGKRLLLAEADFMNRNVMLMMLKSLGFAKVDTAIDGAEAVKRCKQNPLFYDLILMDISMPVLNGVAATIQIRELGLDIPIVAMTGNIPKEAVDRYLAMGMNDYVPKPVNRQVLVEAFKRCLKMRSQSNT